MRRILLVPTILLSAMLLGACGADEPGAQAPAESAPASPSASPTPAESAAPAETSSPTEEATTPTGAYVDLADFDPAAREGTDVVYFFHADWCPDCRATEESLRSDGVPDGLTVVKVDFDEETDLRQEYGVTQQHTFVQIDPDGGRTAVWTGSRTGAEIAAETA